MALIQARELTKVYTMGDQTVHALSGVSLDIAEGEFVAIFDADFIPNRDFLRKTLPWFSDPTIGLVQTRWEHINADYSFMTRVQAMALDGHFVMEHAEVQAGWIKAMRGGRYCGRYTPWRKR